MIPQMDFLDNETYTVRVSVGDTRFSEEKWLYEPNYFSFAPIPTKIGQEVDSGVL